MKTASVHLLPLTREGVCWLLVSSVMLLMGLFKGINLITLLGCWLVTLVALNYCWARPQPRFIMARRLFPEFAFAGAQSSLLIQIENSGKKAAYGIAVRDAGPHYQAMRFLPSLAARSKTTLSIALNIPQRGRYPLDPLVVSSGYPLALVHLSKPMRETNVLVVFPKLGQLKRGGLRRFLAQHSPTVGQARSFPRRQPGAQAEFHGLRPFRAGDSPRWIHWRTTARRGELMVREFEDMPSDNLVLVVVPGLHDNLLLERILSLAATICWEWCRQKGDQLALAVAGPEPSVLVGSTGNECAGSMLERLAVASAGPGSNAALMDVLVAADLPLGPMLLLCAESGNLASEIAQALHRSVAEINLGREEDKDFFEIS